MNDGCEVTVRFCLPPPTLRPYFTTFYQTCVTVGQGPVTDYLHPEWANMRFISGDLPRGQLADEPPLTDASFIVSGPTSTAIRFTVGTIRMWGVGLLPLGWAKFVDAPAALHADKLVNGRHQPVYADFVPLADSLFGEEPDSDAELARIGAHFLARLGIPVPDEARIVACHEAVIDPEVHDVGDLVERSGIPQRTLERVCRRHFGFAPKLLLRRQRFMRSLAQFVLDPRRKWIGALDDHYHDQAQFVRDFRRFMGMSPRQYAALRHPILEAVMRQRMAFSGEPVQALHRPDGSSARVRPRLQASSLAGD
ncbi:MAG: helix-turn-helix domain-containing protein [Novosphingobium sp.]